MSRRPARPRAAALVFDEFNEASVTADEMFTAPGHDDEVDTGILDASGEPTMRPRRRIKFGFVP